MNRPDRSKQAAAFFFTLTIALFAAFFLYMYCFEEISVYQSGTPHSYRVISDVQTQQKIDDTSPVGMQKVYSWDIHLEPNQDNCLCFNVSHNHIQVYMEDELIYSLTGSENNRIGKNVSSNWCTIHLEQEHNGKTLTVILTPLFEAAVSKEPEFLLGSHYAIAMDYLTDEIALLVLSVLCILLGIFVVAVSLYYRCVVKTGSNGIIYLGLFSIAMGLWKITDLYSMPLLLPDAAMALGYISIGALLLTGPCLLLYFSTLFVEKKQRILYLLSIFASVICLVVLAMQLLGIAEIRQNLIVSHVLLIIAIASIPLTSLINRIKHKTPGLQRSWKLLLLIFVGIVLDLLLYYRSNGRSVLSFSIMGFIIYTAITLIIRIQNVAQKAYIDSRTGLANRARWSELMDNKIAVPEPYGIMVIDLNGLKQINDTMGHEVGDQVI
ncbi:MAG: diguanylate cyclase, partial [Eubacteriales bacterium]|nr:diguanylate cyclase [Eubacteriales bacterium]